LEIEADFHSSGGLIGELENTFARMLGKQYGVFMPTGALANHLAVRH
jgi:threonine aldolase